MYAAVNSKAAIRTGIVRISNQAGIRASLMSRSWCNGSIHADTAISAAPTSVTYPPGLTLIRPSDSTEIATRVSTMYSTRPRPRARNPRVASTQEPSLTSGPFSASSSTSASRARTMTRICRPFG